MDLQQRRQAVSNVTALAAILVWMAIGTPCRAQTGRIYAANDYSHAAGFLNGGTVSLVDHAVKKATFLGNDRFWYLDSENGLSTLMVADPVRRTRFAAYDPVRMAVALHAAGLEETDAKRIQPKEFDLLDNDQTARITVNDKRYRCALSTEYRCSLELSGLAGAAGPSVKDASLAVFSPDGKRAVFIRDWN